MAEALFNSLGLGSIKAWCAGSHPTGIINPYAMEKISSLGYKTNQLSSKSWLTFAHPSAPIFDIVITVCGNAAAEDCPVFPGNWCHIHWGLPDPAAHMSSPNLAQEAFDECFNTLKKRIKSAVHQMNTRSNSVNSSNNESCKKRQKTMFIEILKEHATTELCT